MLTPWRVILLSIVLGMYAQAQPLDYSTGGNLKRRQYQTYSALTFYVDPTGSDSNACTASGTAACLTLGGALLKVPRNIKHLVTINVAAGTYTEVFRVQGFFIEGDNGAASTAALTITGTQVNFTPATGSATGTLTAYTNTSTVDGAHPFATDSGATWTVNDLRGRFLQITGGTGSGQYMPIASNTATTITLAAKYTTAPVAGSTYAIVTPGPIFTGASTVIRSLTGAGAVTIQDITIQPASGTAMTTANVTAPLTFRRMRVVGAASGVSNIVDGPQNWTINQSYIAAGTGSGLSVGLNGRLSATDILVNCTGTCSGTGVFNSPRASYITLLTGTVQGVFNNAMILGQGPVTVQSSGLWIDCGNAAANIGILFSAPTDSAAQYVGAGWAQNTGPYIRDCLVGYSLNNPSLSYIDNGSVFVTNTTTAILLSRGARAVIETGTNLSGVTNFLSLDGTVFTDAELTLFTRITGPQGSYATRP